jgi:hypothetical protein
MFETIQGSHSLFHAQPIDFPSLSARLSAPTSDGQGASKKADPSSFDSPLEKAATKPRDDDECERLLSFNMTSQSILLSLVYFITESGQKGKKGGKSSTRLGLHHTLAPHFSGLTLFHLMYIL